MTCYDEECLYKTHNGASENGLIEEADVDQGVNDLRMMFLYYEHSFSG